MKITIDPLTLRVATWVAANMCAKDEAEIMCQMPPGSTKSDAGIACFFSTQAEWMWDAAIDASPVACFGLSPMTVTTWLGWAYGTDRMRRALPAISRHFLSQERRLLDAGCRRIEVRTMKGHDEAHLWIARLGGKHRLDLPDAGRNGETFELWSWQYSEMF